MHYIEKGVEILSALENANTLGCIFTHKHDITTYLLENLTPSSYVAYAKIRKSFTRYIMHSTLDICMRHLQDMSAPFQNYLETDQETHDQLIQEERDKYNQIDFRPSYSQSYHPIPVCHNIPLHMHVCKRCHQCHKWGHIRATCPTCPYCRLRLHK